MIKKSGPHSETPDVSVSPEVSDEHRRGFFTKAAALMIGGLVALIPLASGLAVFLDPLRKRGASRGFLRVTALGSVPEDGTPRQFPVIADRTDAWNRYPDEPIGAVYLRRQPETGKVQCFNAICPHAGCFVEFNASERQFQCPCHESNFQPDGTRINPESCPSPRDLDALAVDEARLQNGEVWVEFKNFLSGTPEMKERG